jgi:quinol monooxygenase YgiN
LIASQTLKEPTTVRPHIAQTTKTTRRAAAVLLSLLVSGCAPTTRGSTATPSGSLSDPAASTDPSASSGRSQGMMVRISEIQIDPSRLAEYNAILREEAEASVRLEPGVISIFPMYQREHPTEVRILEIYASRAAYESHTRSPHFEKYKTTTLPMVTSLKLIDMALIDPATMPAIFAKMRGGR